MRRCAATLTLVIVGLSAATCVGRPTQIVLHVGSNAPPDRAAQLSIVTRVGAASRDDLLAFRGQITRVEDSARAIFPGSVGLLPAAQGPRGSALTVWAVLELPAVAGQPALRVERLQRLLLIERVPQLARMFSSTSRAPA